MLEQGIGSAQIAALGRHTTWAQQTGRRSPAQALGELVARDAAMATGGWDLPSAPRKYPLGAIVVKARRY